MPSRRMNSSISRSKDSVSYTSIMKGFFVGLSKQSVLVRVFNYTFILIATSALAYLHQYGSSSGLYMTTYYFDVMMHGLAGVIVGYVFSWIFGCLAYGKGFTYLSGLRRIFDVLLLSLLVGIAWEIFEYVFGLLDWSLGETYWSDTMVDILMDVIGATLAVILYKIVCIVEFIYGKKSAKNR